MLDTVFIFLVIASAVAVCEQSAEATCSRSLSRLARQRVEAGVLNYISKVVGTNEVFKLNPRCPLINDIYSTEYEDRIQEGTSWRCLLCGKLFQTEDFLDDHVARKHSLVNEEDGAVYSSGCLADHCDWLRCEVITAPEDLPYWRKALCDRWDMARRQERCLNVLSSCLPSNSDMNEEILSYANETLCSFLTCESYWERDHLDMSKIQSFFKVAGATMVVLLVFCYYILVLQMYCEGEIVTDGEGTTDKELKENLRLEMPTRFSDVQNVRKRTALPQSMGLYNPSSAFDDS